MKPKASKAKSASIPQTAPVPASLETLNQQFAKAQKTTNDNGSNSNNHVEDFVRCADFVLRANRSFSFHNIAYACFPLGIPIEEVKRLWAEYRDVLMAKCKLERIEGCDGELFIVI